MNKRLVGAIAVAAFALGSWAIWAGACDRDKQATAQAALNHGTIVVAAAAGANGCATATAAECKAHGNASSASAGAMPECCSGKSHGATASLGHDACGSGSLGAGMIGAPVCSHGAATASVDMKGGCDACGDMVTCSNQMAANDAQVQIVPLRNGVMFVYTTDTPAHVRAVQNAAARRGDRLVALAQSGDRAKLCPECSSARGAIASGKLTRETVNIEGGCMTLVTSTDPAMVAKLRAMAATGNGRNKS